MCSANLSLQNLPKLEPIIILIIAAHHLPEVTRAGRMYKADDQETRVYRT